MRGIGIGMIRASSLALAVASLSAPAFAQSNTTADAREGDVIVVTGIRASLEKALEIKRESTQVVDSIVAEDIGKLPDNNVVEALQRVSGVQVTNRGAGETNTISIRGLPDALTTFNGRKIFTASGDGFALADIPANLVSRVDVYKTRSASQIETGLAGQVDVRTRRPFDFDGFAFSVGARGIYGEAAEEFNPNLSALISNRWETEAGDFGALLSVSFAQTKYRDMSVFAGAVVPFATENPPAGTGLTPLQRIFPDGTNWQPGLETGLPYTAGSTMQVNGITTPYYLARDAMFAPDVYGTRKRPALTAALQWAPDADMTWTAEFLYNGYRSTTFNNLHFTFADWWGSLGPNPGSTFELYEGTNIISSRTVGFPFGFNSGDYSTGKTDSYVGALNLNWQVSDVFHLTSDLSYQSSTFSTQFQAMRITRVPASITVDFNTGNGVPGWTFGDDALLADPAQWTIGEFYDNANRSKGDAVTWSTDGRWDLGDGFLKAGRMGFRYDRRGAADSVRAQDAPFLGRPLTSLPVESYFISQDFYNGRANVPSSWINVSGDWIHDNADLVRELYRSTNDPGLLLSDALSLTEVFNVTEQTFSAYAELDGEVRFGNSRLFVQAGVRYVDVVTDLHFTDRITNTATDGKAKAQKWLPSFTVIFDPTENFRLRFNYGETLRRPGFSDLNPYYNLTGDLTQIGRGSGGGGNPGLKPTLSTNYDFSVEYYFQPGSAVYATAFIRKVDGLVVPLTTLLTITGTGLNTNVFAVTRPENASDGTLKGAEFGFVYFPTLPGILNGLGATGSLTILDSKQTIPISNEAGQITATTESAFFGVSNLSYNMTLAYDKGHFGARLSYVWRKNFLAGNEARLFANPIGQWRRPERSLDFQLTYSLNDKLDLTFDAVNITDELEQSYYRFGEFGNPDQFNFGNRLIGRTVAVGVRFSID